MKRLRLVYRLTSTDRTFTDLLLLIARFAAFTYWNFHRLITSRLPTDEYRSYIHRLTFTDWDFYRFGLLMSLVGQVTFCAIKLKSISFENWKICPFAAVWLICRKYFKISLQYKCSLKMSNFSQIYTKRTVWWQSLTTSVSENAYIFQILRLDWCLWK